MLKNKIIAVFAIVIMLLAVFAVPVVAESTASEARVTYTSDCAVSSGVYVTTTVDALTGQTLLIINDNLPAGYVIYDDPSTDYIDGIRVNGLTVNTLQTPIEPEGTVYEVVVKTTYADGFTGTLAQISDGTYDWTKLLENPIGLLTALYYVLATVSVVVSIVLLFRGKHTKAKTTSEISKAVADTAQVTATKTIEDEVLPIVSAFQNTAQSLVKAFALTTSKSKDAPVALLDVLQEVSNTDAAAAIEQAKQLIAASQAQLESAKQDTIDKLNKIANASQEALDNETKSTRDEDVPIF